MAICPRVSDECTTKMDSFAGELTDFFMGPIQRKWWLLIPGTAILLIPALYNGYPLVFSDTGTYLYSGFDGFVPKDRPLPYGLFVKAFSLSTSLWLVAVFQCLIMAYLLYRTMGIFYTKKDKTMDLHYLLMLIFLTFFSSIGWYAGQVMPDIFAPALVLSMLVLLLGNEPGTAERILLILILVFSITVHLTHMFMAPLFLAVSALTAALMKKHRLPVPAKSLRKKFATLILATALGWILLPAVHYLYGGGFRLSGSGHIFLMAHFADAGTLQQFLKEHCHEPAYAGYRLCEHCDEIPGDVAGFLWDDESVLFKTGGWENSEKEYKSVIRDMLSSPKYLFRNICRSATYGFIQMFRNKTGEGLTAYVKGSAPWGQVNWRFPGEVNMYMSSLQNKWNGARLDFTSMNVFHLLVLIFSLLFTVFLIFSSMAGEVATRLRFLFLLVIMAMVVNAFVTGGLSSPYDRLQSRVVWLLPMACLLILFKYRRLFVRTLKDRF